MSRPLIFVGLAIVVIGLLWPWLSKLPVGRLPGDILIDRPGMRFYIPITTSLLVSAIVSIVVWLLRR
jgi:Protein of unknown function (DUF2905)